MEAAVITLSPDELATRVAILRRYKQALVRQRERFRGYLGVLETRTPGAVEDELLFHVELERTILREIASFERTIEPLETLYRSTDPDGASEIPALRDALHRTRDEVLRRTQENQRLLRTRIGAIRSEISKLRASARS